MSNLRIENSIAGVQPFDPEGNLNNSFDVDLMNNDVRRYWTSAFKEKIFPISFWKAEELITSSNLDQLAFKIINMETPSDVEASWVSFNVETSESSTNASEKDRTIHAAKKVISIVSNLFFSGTEAYFVFGEDILSIFRSALIQLGLETTFQTINARIGKTEGGLTVVYFMLGSIELHLDGATAALSDTCGVKIPPRR